MKNVHRLATLSMSSVVLAACAGGGSTSAPPVSTGTPAANHPANASLTVTFPKNLLHFPKTTARKPKFADPQYSPQLLVFVTPSSQPAYLAADVPLSENASGNSQAIPIYLQPGVTSNIDVQEWNTDPFVNGAYGYLLAQGDTTASGSETTSNQITDSLNMAVYSIDVATDVSGFSTTPYKMLPTSNASGTYCPSSVVGGSTNSIYFVPADYNGIGALASSTTVNGYAGVPTPTITWQSINPGSGANPVPNSGTSKLIPNLFGGYTISIDSAGDGILVTGTYTGISASHTYQSFSPGSIIGEEMAGPATLYLSLDPNAC